MYNTENSRRWASIARFHVDRSACESSHEGTAGGGRGYLHETQAVLGVLHDQTYSSSTCMYAAVNTLYLRTGCEEKSNSVVRSHGAATEGDPRIEGEGRLCALKTRGVLEERLVHTVRNVPCQSNMLRRKISPDVTARDVACCELTCCMHTRRIRMRYSACSGASKYWSYKKYLGMPPPSPP